MKHPALALPLVFTAVAGLGTWRHLEAASAATPTALAASINALRTPGLAGEPSPFPTQWNAGLDCATEPKVQVFAYDEDTYVLRQGKCEIYESPFLYLLFGEDQAILMDTGANNQTNIPRVVKRIVDQWLAANGRESIPLVVAHTHTHFDHIQGDAQFAAQPWVQEVIGLPASVSNAFWGFQDYPNDVPTIDLGGRVIDVLGTPGHHPSSVTLYDRNTRLLLTGDIVYPGHLFVFSASEWGDFVQSLGRLTNWAATHPVDWVLGCHIETGDTPGSAFAYGTASHPNEHSLEFSPSILAEIWRQARSMGSSPQCQIFDEFVIHPVYLCGIGWNG